jgi:AbiV family abortive infection protein
MRCTISGVCGSDARVILRPIFAREPLGYPLRCVTHRSVRSRGNDWQMMAAKRLPDEHEAAEGAALAAANAVALLGDADHLADAERFGSAVSLAVLAFEESVKARTLGAITAAAAQGRRPGFSDDALLKIIYNGHQARHHAGLLQHVAATSPNVFGKSMLGIALSADERATLQTLADLVASANARKQAGFYTDFDPESGCWSTPGTVSGTEFRKIRTLVGGFVTETQRQTSEFMSFWNAPAGPAPAQ